MLFCTKLSDKKLSLLLPTQKKNAPAYKKIKNNTGQAIIEYLLILIVVVMLGGVISKVNSKLSTFGKALLGPDRGYIACLLQTGSLPTQTTLCSLKSISDDLSSISNNKSNNNNANSSANNNSDNSSNSNSANNNSNNSSNNNSANNNTHKNNKNRSKKSTKGSLISLNSSSSSSSSLLKSTENKKGASSGDTKDASKSRKKHSSFRAYNKSSHSSDSEHSGTLFRIHTSHGMSEEEEENTTIATSSTRTVSAKKGNLAQQKTLHLIKKIKTKKQEEIKDGAWSFGKVFRIVLIICIVLAIILVIGSQTLQVQKSMK